jgi:hypothetical protein
MQTFLGMTNAVKAQIIVVINALLALLEEFGLNLTDGQQTAIIVLVNAVLALWVGLTYSYSHKRQE